MPTTPKDLSSSRQEISPSTRRMEDGQASEQPSAVPAHRSAEMARRMFEHLESIHQIQSEIASQHQALEDVELAVDGHFKSKRPETSRPDSSSNIRHNQHHSGISGLQDPGSSSESVRQQFLNRQKAVNGLMIKVFQLSFPPLLSHIHLAYHLFSSPTSL